MDVGLFCHLLKLWRTSQNFSFCCEGTRTQLGKSALKLRARFQVGLCGNKFFLAQTVKGHEDNNNSVPGRHTVVMNLSPYRRRPTTHVHVDLYTHQYVRSLDRPTVYSSGYRVIIL